MNINNFVVKLSMIAIACFLFSCSTEDATMENTMAEELIEASSSKSTGTATLNRTTGEYRAAPGSLIKMEYYGVKRAPCTVQEHLTIYVGGRRKARLTWRKNSSNRGSKNFRMPASGVVKIKALMSTDGLGGCSSAYIRLNGAHQINLGIGQGQQINSFPL